jgi:serine/threonine protein kinase
MQIQTAESLLAALGDSGLFSPAELAALAQEAAPFAGGGPQAVLKHLARTGLVPVHQLRKVFHGRAAELFVGPYVVLDKLGEGGMGKVYKARDTRDGTVVALKIIRSNLLANPVARGRYEREVQAARALRHPNIAAAVDAGEAGERYYLAMEFVDGIDLARLVRAFGVLPVPEACEYVRQAALGLHHAHEMGLVHRDIKPSNIVVSGERHHPGATEPARVKLLDMGLVRCAGFDDGTGSGDVDLTRAGTVVGTPDYMAPEQAKNSRTVDRRGDLYSLGGTFYFLLTGRPPFPAGSPIEKILKHQLDPPPPLQAARPDVPDELAWIVARLMAKKPADRFQSARELAAALAPLTQFTDGTAPLPVLRPTELDGPGAETLPPPEKTAPPPSVLSPPRDRSRPDRAARRTPVANRPPRSRKNPGSVREVPPEPASRDGRAAAWITAVVMAALLIGFAVWLTLARG